MKRHYGLNRDDYDKMLLSQKGKCPICNNKLQRPHVDHNHLTGKIRSILCSQCNTGLGMFKENKDYLNAAIKYLRYNK